MMCSGKRWIGQEGWIGGSVTSLGSEEPEVWAIGVGGGSISTSGREAGWGKGPRGVRPLYSDPAHGALPPSLPDA
jgi:hypothetical protein